MTSPQDTLQGYFDELLVTEEVSKVAPQPTPSTSVDSVAPPARKPEPKLKAQNIVTPKLRAQVKEHENEQLARDKLAKLLSSAPPKPVSAKAEPITVAPTKQVQTQARAAPPEVTLPSVKVVETEIVTEVKIESDVDSKPEQEIDAVPKSDVDLSWADNGRPQWAQERFEVLLFEVAGLTLAVPLISLGQIQPLTDELTPLFGQADWFMGLLPTPGGKIRTINTAKFVMPERYQDSFLDAARYVVSINGLPWGLAVDEVNQPITLQPDDVKWRGERSKRPWLAGTVKEHMCALVDVATMGQLLSEADKAGSKQDPLTDNL